MSPVSELEAELRRLATRYADRNAVDLAALEAALARYEADPAATRRVIEHIAHRIAGTGAMLGFAGISDAAASLERLAAAEPAPEAASLHSALATLRQAVGDGVRTLR